MASEYLGFSREELMEHFKYVPETGELIRLQHPTERDLIGKDASFFDHSGGMRVNLKRKPLLAHRVAWLITYGDLPKLCIDHINGDFRDNRISNLRLATYSQNQMNRAWSKRGRNNPKGVVWHKRDEKWLAQIQINKKKKFLGYFSAKEEAMDAYDKAAVEIFGEFACTNKMLSERRNAA